MDHPKKSHAWKSDWAEVRHAAAGTIIALVGGHHKPPWPFHMTCGTHSSAMMWMQSWNVVRDARPGKVDASACRGGGG